MVHCASEGFATLSGSVTATSWRLRTPAPAESGTPPHRMGTIPRAAARERVAAARGLGACPTGAAVCIPGATSSSHRIKLAIPRACIRATLRPASVIRAHDARFRRRHAITRYTISRDRAWAVQRVPGFAAVRGVRSRPGALGRATRCQWHWRKANDRAGERGAKSERILRPGARLPLQRLGDFTSTGEDNTPHRSLSSREGGKRRTWAPTRRINRYASAVAARKGAASLRLPQPHGSSIITTWVTVKGGFQDTRREGRV